MRRRRIFAPYLFCLFWAIALAALLPAQSLSRYQVEKDAAALRRMLLYSHPKPDQYVGRDSLERLLLALGRIEGDSISIPQWEERVRAAIQPLGCGHTYVSGGLRTPRSKRKPLPAPRLLPFQIFTDGRRLWATEQTDSSRQWLQPGSEILLINGRSAGEILRRFEHYQTADGFNRTFSIRLLNRQRFFNYLYRKYFPLDTLVQVEWRTPDQTILSAAIPTVSDKKLKRERPAQRPDSLVLHRRRGQYFYYNPEQPQVGILKIPSFTGRTGKMYKRVFRTLKQRKTPYLVIDLRDNLGGSFGASMDLARYIAAKRIQMDVSRPLKRSWRHMTLFQRVGRMSALMEFDVFNPMPRRLSKGRFHYRFRFRPHRRYHYDGQTYILVNGWSCSASSVFSAYARELGNNVRIIGEESGGGGRSLNGMKIPRFRLPESGIRLSMPQYHLDFQLGPDEGKGVLPDYPVVYTIQDVLEGRDLEWEQLRRLIPR